MEVWCDMMGESKMFLRKWEIFGMRKFIWWNKGFVGYIYYFEFYFNGRENFLIVIVIWVGLSYKKNDSGES